jgi:hypothetical protein
MSLGLKRNLAVAAGILLAIPVVGAQSLYVERLSSDALAVKSPAERVRGARGGGDAGAPRGAPGRG